MSHLSRGQQNQQRRHTCLWLPSLGSGQAEGTRLLPPPQCAATHAHRHKGAATRDHRAVLAHTRLQTRSMPTQRSIDTYGASGLVHARSKHYLGTPPAAASHITGKATAQLCSPNRGLWLVQGMQPTVCPVWPGQSPAEHAHTHPQHRTRVAGERAALPHQSEPTTSSTYCLALWRLHVHQGPPVRGTERNPVLCLSSWKKTLHTPRTHTHTQDQPPPCCTQSTHPTRDLTTSATPETLTHLSHSSGPDKRHSRHPSERHSTSSNR